MKLRHGMADWGLLLALTVLWGSAFLFTKVAVGSIPSQLVAAGRLAIAASLLVPLALVVAGSLPAGKRLWLFLFLIAVFGNVLPFLLITWGQAYIDSGLAGILMAAMPLATLSLAHFLVPGERLTTFRVGGFVLGFGGVVAIMGPESLDTLVDGGSQLLPMSAVLAGAFCYALSAVFARLRPASDALPSAAATTLLATFMIAPFALAADHPPAPAPSLSALAAVGMLGAFSTALAGVLYFRLIKTAGPSFVSQLNYLIPLWAVAVGVVFLDERPESKHLLGLCLILGGILVSHLEQPRARRCRQPGSEDEVGSTA